MTVGRRSSAKRSRARRNTTSPRRLRLPVVLPLAFAAFVLVTSMPVSALLTQRHQLADTTAALARVRSADQALTAESRALSNPATVAGLARNDYGLVPPGQKAYVILPPAGSSSAEVLGSGHIPLGTAPVVPGSPQSRALLGLGSSPAPSGAGSEKHPSGSASSHASEAPTSFWGRVARTLEFWR